MDDKEKVEAEIIRLAEQAHEEHGVKKSRVVAGVGSALSKIVGRGWI